MIRRESTRKVFYGISPAHKQKQESRLRETQGAPKRLLWRIILIPKVSARNYRDLLLTNAIEPLDLRPHFRAVGNHSVRGLPPRGLSYNVARDAKAIPPDEVLKPA